VTVHFLPAESTRVSLHVPCPRTRTNIPEIVAVSEGLRVMKSSLIAEMCELAQMYTTHRVECIVIDKK
jgi:hypothetical protein